MKHTGLFPAIAALAFFSLLLFGSGAFLHGTSHPPLPSSPNGSTAQSKGAASAHHGKGKAAPKPVMPKPAASSAAPENALAFPLLLAGGVGLLVSALAALGLCRAQAASQPLAARRMQESENAARLKQQEEFEAQRSALQTQLSDARQRKAETEALRDQVSRQFQEFFRTLPVPCFCFAANGRIIRWNAACETLYGISAARALESTLWETIVPVSEREDAEGKISRVLAGESLLAMERWDTVAGDELLKLRCSMVPLYDADGMIIGGLSAGVDITEMAQYEQQMEALNAALEDAQAATKLTAPPSDLPAAPAAPAEIAVAELAGHPAFRIRLAEEVKRAARYHAPLSLVLLDLDGFAAWNKAFGFEAGDDALLSAVGVIKSKIRTVDALVRLGADEYAVILPETGEAGARVAAERLRTGLSGTSRSGCPPLTACFGVALLTPEISGAEMLAARALEALESARSCGANTIVHFQDMAENGLPSLTVPAPARQKAR